MRMSPPVGNANCLCWYRAVRGNKVIDDEEVTSTFPEGPGKIHLLAIYEVQDGKLGKACFMSGLPQVPASESQFD